MGNRYLTDPYWILKYNLIGIMLCAIAIAVTLAPLNHIPWYWYAGLLPIMFPNLLIIVMGSAIYILAFLIVNRAALHSWHYMLVLISFYLGGYSAVLIHNAHHLCYKPKWINRVIGELCGFHQLNVFQSFVAFHSPHHRYPDHPLYDPNPPSGYSYTGYLFHLTPMIAKSLGLHHSKAFGSKLANYKKVTNFARIVALFARSLRLLTLLLLLRPELFACLFLPSFLSQILLFSHVSYYTHQDNSNGKAEILNLNHNLYYKVANFFYCGIYFHMNHHLAPRMANPRFFVPNQKV